MKYTFEPIATEDSWKLFAFLQKLRGVKMKKGDVLFIPGNITDLIPLNTFCLLFNAQPGNTSCELVVTRGFHVHSVWTRPEGAKQSVNIDITREGEDMECEDKQENNDAGDSKAERRLYLPPKSTQVGGDHYSKMKIQPIDFITANGIGYIEGNIIKYVCRYKSKNGVEDLKKAQHYLQMLIEQEEKNIGVML